MSVIPRRHPVPPALLLALVLVALLAVVLGRQIPAGHLTNTDELFTAERARELRFSGPGAVWDNFRPVYHKPPLQYWLTAGALAVWPGNPETAARLPALLYAVATAGLVAALARALAPELPWAAPLAVGIFVTCPQTLVEGGRALLDMGLTCWTTLTLLAAQRARSGPGWWWLVAGTAAAAGSLQKIPLPVGALAGVLAMRLSLSAGRTNLRRARGPLLGGLALALAGTVLWPLLQAGLHAMPAGGAFALDEAGKLRGNARLGARSAWEVLVRLTARWSWGLFALASAVVATAAGLRRTVPRDRGESVVQTAAAGEVAWVCLGIVLAATLGGFRSVRYVLPAVPGLCVLAAVAVTRFGWGEARRGNRRWRRLAGVTLTVGLFALGAPAAWHKVRALPPAAPDQHALAVALGGERRPGEAAVLVREPDDEAAPDGVLPEEFYLFYGRLCASVQSVTRAGWETWTPPPGGAWGVCRAGDFPRFHARVPGAERRLARGAFVLWRVPGGEGPR